MAYRFVDLPVTAISRPGYALVQRAEGDSVYSDRAYIFTRIPDRLVDWFWISTANDDKANSEEKFLEFYAAKAMKIIVGVDADVQTPPAWLQGWTLLDEGIVTNDTAFRLYEKEYAPGMVTLGGNGMSTSSSMYLVLLQPNASTGIDLPPAPPAGVRVIYIE